MATKKTDAAPPPEAPQPPTPEPAPTPSTTRDRFFAWFRALNLRREPGWLGGVAAGIGVRLGIDPIIVRGILVVVAVLGGPALILYAAAWLLLPDSNDKIHLEELLKGNFESAIAGIGTLVLLSLLPVAQGFWFAGAAFWGEPYWGPSIGRALWTLAVLAAIVLLIIWIARRGALPPAPPLKTPPPTAAASAEEFTAWRAQQDAFKAENDAFRKQEASDKAAAWKVEHERQQAEAARQRAIRAEKNRRTRSHPLYSFLVIGIALVAGGLTTLFFHNGEVQVTSVIAGLAVALAILGLGIIINGLRGKRSGGASAVASLTLIPLVIFALIPQTPHLEYAGGGYYAPSDSDSESDVYFVGAGDVTFSLSGYYADGSVDTRVGDDVYLFLGAGDVTVTLPEGAFVGVNTYVGSGAVETRDADGDIEDHSRVTYVTYAPEDPDAATGETPILQVKIFVGSGTVTIVEPSSSKEQN